MTRAFAVGLAVAALLVGAGVTLLVAGGSSPTDGSAEAGFARDMSDHHGQAVQMAGIVLDTRPSEEIEVLADDIMLSQQAQIGQMQGWLNLWELSSSRGGTPMEWMGLGGMPMSGMASGNQLDELRAARGGEAERLFLQLMIEHHRGGLQMAQAVLDRTVQPAVRELANAMVVAQAAEIDQMEALLEGR